MSGHAAFLQERGEQLAAAYTHLWVSVGVLRAPRLGVHLWEDGALLLSSASMGLCQDCFCLLLLCPLQLTMGWERSLILLLGSGTDFMVCTSVGRGFHPSICSQGSGSVIPWC